MLTWVSSRELREGVAGKMELWLLMLVSLLIIPNMNCSVSCYINMVYSKNMFRILFLCNFASIYVRVSK